MSKNNGSLAWGATKKNREEKEAAKSSNQGGPQASSDPQPSTNANASNQKPQQTSHSQQPRPTSTNNNTTQQTKNTNPTPAFAPPQQTTKPLTFAEIQAQELALKKQQSNPQQNNNQGMGMHPNYQMNRNVADSGNNTCVSFPNAHDRCAKVVLTVTM